LKSGAPFSENAVNIGHSGFWSFAMMATISFGIASPSLAIWHQLAPT
jgi:hypothetical protein